LCIDAGWRGLAADLLAGEADQLMSSGRQAALARVATLRFEVGRYADCVGVCQQLASRDTCREDITRLLMRCFARLNQPHLAVHQYQLCERQLRIELGMEPADATRRLYEQIRRRQPV
jgi:DNA-binding SARP family transcriptional activator